MQQKTGKTDLDDYPAGSRRALLHMQQWAVGRRHGRHLESVTSFQKSNSVSRYVFM